MFYAVNGILSKAELSVTRSTNTGVGWCSYCYRRMFLWTAFVVVTLDTMGAVMCSAHSTYLIVFTQERHLLARGIAAEWEFLYLLFSHLSCVAALLSHSCLNN